MNARTSKKLLINKGDALKHADALSLRMCNLGKTMELAAFAADARRVLVGIDDAIFFRPEIKKTLNDSIPYFSEWKEWEDASGEVLRHLAIQIQQLNEEFTTAVYDVANALE